MTQTQQKTPARKRGRPPKNKQGFEDTKTALIRCGMELLTEQGFINTGLEQILKKVNVPKGSFYYYFENKEAFGYVVLDHYANYFIHKLEKHLIHSDLPALERLQAFMQDATQGMKRFNYKRGCLVGNLTQEFGSSHPEFKEKLEAIFEQWKTLVSNCLALAVEENTLAPTTDCESLADFFWIGWEGAVMHSKLTESEQPMRLFATQFLKLLPQQTQ